MRDERHVGATPGEALPTGNGGKQGWIAALSVAALAAGVVAYKELGTPSKLVRRAPTTSVGAGAARTGAGSVLLFADPSEAQSSCGCGQIIRLVREAVAHGVAVREVAPGADAALEREHRVTVVPTVLFLDAGGRVVARYEGETHETIAALRAGLDGLKAKR